MRKPILAANWKMHYGRLEPARAFARKILHPLHEITQADSVICPPYSVLPELAELTRPLRVGLGAQNGHWESEGAYTGEVSLDMLAEICQYVILGHSERRATGSRFEEEEALQRKVQRALELGLTPILCVGEDKGQREQGHTESFVRGQVRSALEGRSGEEVARCVIAYEPIWAIGTGEAATPAEANRVIGLVIRDALAEGWGESTAQQTRVQYGGSVNPANIGEFMVMPEIDGALVGGASLTEDFVTLVRRGAEAK